MAPGNSRANGEKMPANTKVVSVKYTGSNAPGAQSQAGGQPGTPQAAMGPGGPGAPPMQGPAGGPPAAPAGPQGYPQGPAGGAQGIQGPGPAQDPRERLRQAEQEMTMQTAVWGANEALTTISNGGLEYQPANAGDFQFTYVPEDQRSNS